MKLSTASICYPPHLKYLPDHLRSIDKARAGRDITIHVMNSSMKPEYIEEGKSIVDRLGIKDIQLSQTTEKYSIGRARNALYDLAESDWIIFLDADTVVDPGYINNLERFMKTQDLSETFGITGLIVPNKASPLGKYECLMDVFALISKVEGNKRELYGAMNLPAQINIQDEEFWQQLPVYLSVLSGNKISYLQGTNQILRGEVKDIFGGFRNDQEFAEDRDLATRVLLSGRNIKFSPELVVKHNYDFGIIDIIKRKMFHARCTEAYLRTYGSTSDKINSYDAFDWIKFISTAFKPKHPFNSDFTGRLYSFVSTLAYTGASMSEIIRHRRGL